MDELLDTFEHRMEFELSLNATQTAHARQILSGLMDIIEPQQTGINERRINSLYTTNTTATWAKNQLRILHDMLDDRSTGVIKTPLSMSWIAQEINRIETGIQLTE